MPNPLTARDQVQQQQPHEGQPKSLLLSPAEPGRLMAHHCISLKTMASICVTPKGAGGEERVARSAVGVRMLKT